MGIEFYGITRACGLAFDFGCYVVFFNVRVCRVCCGWRIYMHIEKLGSSLNIIMYGVRCVSNGIAYNR